MLPTELRVYIYVSIFDGGRGQNRSCFFLMFLLREELFQMAFNFFFLTKLYNSQFRALFISVFLL